MVACLHASIEIAALQQVERMEMHQVRYFLAVCEHLSFTQAARRCYVTQPSLTRAIQLLEKEFGGHLFHRERSRIHLTELGRIVQPYLQEAWENAQVAKRQAKDYVSRAPTQLKLAIMCTIAPALLIQLFTRFRASRPDVKLELIDAAGETASLRTAQGVGIRSRGMPLRSLSARTTRPLPELP